MLVAAVILEMMVSVLIFSSATLQIFLLLIVILPQLTNFSIFMSQMTNHTRKIDMALALVEAFTHVVYSPLNKESISTVVKPGLK